MNMLALLAHAGHMGDHGWLTGALQPMLSLDHFLAGLFVAVPLSLGLGRLALTARAIRGEASREGLTRVSLRARPGTAYNLLLRPFACHPSRGRRSRYHR